MMGPFPADIFSREGRVKEKLTKQNPYLVLSITIVVLVGPLTVVLFAGVKHKIVAATWAVGMDFRGKDQLACAILLLPTIGRVAMVTKELDRGREADLRTSLLTYDHATLK